jgi:UTP-glucose-1-phosphate uridylyltransferase
LPLNFLSDLRDAYIRQTSTLFASLKELRLEEISQKSSVRFNPNGGIAEILEKPTLEQVSTSIGAAPFFIVPPEIGRSLADLTLSARGEFELPDVLNRMIQDNHPMNGILQPQPPEWKKPD